jgi:hypothetical protein
MPLEKTKTCALCVALSLTAVDASAQVCDYRPSELLRSERVATVVTTARDTARQIVTDGAAVVTLRDVVSGASLLGAQTGGGGALGQVFTTAGNAVVGAASTPGAVIAGGAALVGAGAYEGVCHFRDARITDYDEILGLMTAIAAFADPDYFRLVDDGSDRNGARIVLGDGTGETVDFEVRRLRIVNGVLLHREWGRDTALGNLGVLTSTIAQD